MKGVNVTDHLTAAAQYIAIAESADAKREAYIKAADEISAWLAEDTTRSFREVDRFLNRSNGYSRRLVQWRTSGVVASGPFSEAAGKPNRDESGARSVLATAEPETVERIVAELPPERRDVIVDAIASTEGAVRPKSTAPRPEDQGWYPRRLLSESVFRAWRAWSKMQDELPPDDDVRSHCIALAAKLRRYADAIDRLLTDGDVDEELSEWREELES